MKITISLQIKRNADFIGREQVLVFCFRSQLTGYTQHKMIKFGCFVYGANSLGTHRYNDKVWLFCFRSQLTGYTQINCLHVPCSAHLPPHLLPWLIETIVKKKIDLLFYTILSFSIFIDFFPLFFSMIDFFL